MMPRIKNKYHASIDSKISKKESSPYTDFPNLQMADNISKTPIYKLPEEVSPDN